MGGFIRLSSDGNTSIMHLIVAIVILLIDVNNRIIVKVKEKEKAFNNIPAKASHLDSICMSVPLEVLNNKGIGTSCQTFDFPQRLLRNLSSQSSPLLPEYHMGACPLTFDLDL